MTNKRRKVPYIFSTLLIILGIILILPGLIFADDASGGSSCPGGSFFEGNYNVDNLPPGLSGFKIDYNPGTGNYPADNPVITITEKIGDYGIKWQVFDPSVTVYVVAMKGGNDTNVYYYSSGATSGTNCTLINPNNGKNFGISHIVFGYKITDETTTTTIPDETTTTIPDETTTTIPDETTTTIPDETTTTIPDETTTTIPDETTTTIPDETTTTIPDETTTTIPDETTTTIPDETTTTIPDETTTTIPDETTTTIPDETTTTVPNETTTTIPDETTTTTPGETTTTVPVGTTTTVPGDTTTTVPDIITTVITVLGIQETGQIDVLGIQDLPFTGIRENLVIAGLMFIIIGLMTMIMVPVLRRTGKHQKA